MLRVIEINMVGQVMNFCPGNWFCSVYEKFLTPDTIWTDATRTKIKEIHKSRLDSVTVNNIGGLECQKCHY